MLKKQYHLILIIIMGCLVMAFVDGYLLPGYFMKSIIKIVFFFILPLFFLKPHIKSLFRFEKKGMIGALGIGIAVYLLILGAYFIVAQFYDFSLITDILMNEVGVNQDNFLFVGLYISICNSLLEEFFFRGLAFLELKKCLGRKKSYIFSSLSFALYHIAIMKGWFSLGLFVLALLGLMIGGCIFNVLDEKSENIYLSWMVHMFANLAINTVGFILFGGL